MSIVQKINEYLTKREFTVNESIKYEFGNLCGWALKRQVMESSERKGGLYLSSCGKCTRAQAYNFHSIEKSGKEQDSRSAIVFLYGDIIENMIVALAKTAGCDIFATGLSQLKVPIKVGDKTIIGHSDGLVFDDGIKLFECKSMSSYAFNMFQRGEINPEYMSQINMYLEGTKLDQCMLVAFAKDSGMLGEKLITKDPEIVKDGYRRLKEVLDSTPKKLPMREHTFDSKGHLPWNCTFCSFYNVCWEDKIERVLVGKSYKLKRK